MADAKYFCWSCGNEQIFDVKVGIKVGRRDSCPHCAADLHVCKNCKQWDPAIHNQCREPEAAFIRDRLNCFPDHPWASRCMEHRNAFPLSMLEQSDRTKCRFLVCNNLIADRFPIYRIME